MNSHSPTGSLWHRWDLHFHTPSSYDYKDGSVTDEQIVERLAAENVRVIAITDHHTMDVKRIQHLQKLGSNKLTVLPGIELRSDQGGEPIHYIAIFPEDCDLAHVWTVLQGQLGLTAAGIKERGGDDKVYVPIEIGAKVTRELGGVVSIHAGAKSNSIESIRNTEQFQQRIKLDITNQWVDLMEVGQIKDIDVHLKMIFPATGLSKPLIICSDNHKISDYAIKAPLWFRADPTFRGLLMVLREPTERVFIGDRPEEDIRIEQNPTKYVRSITFARKTGAPASQRWFNGAIPLNPGLVAIVGNKGSGKSALADTLGLLGASQNADSFPFLSKRRFRHPTGGYADHFDATIEWRSGEKLTRCLAHSADPDELERLKYLPQDHVENVCNELVGIGGREFEGELKSVIFSHVPEAQRLRQSSLDDLVRFQTDEKQKRIDTLLKQLREVSRARAAQEVQADPATRREIEEKIKRRQSEIEAHDKAKPPEVLSPSAQGSATPADPTALAELEAKEKAKGEIEKQIAAAEEALRAAVRRQAVARRLIEKLDNFKKEYDAFEGSLTAETTELNLRVNDLISLTLKKEAVEKIRDDSGALIASTQRQLDDSDPKNLKGQLTQTKRDLAGVQARLDAPNRAYQAYLKLLDEWQAKRSELEGSKGSPDSLKGLETALAALDKVPAQITASRNAQRKLALEIHTEKMAQVAVYRTLYGPVQKFIDSHDLAKGKLKLEFQAELTNEDFSERLLGILALNRKGSFMGVDEGKAKVQAFTETTHWEEAKSLGEFLDCIDDALHNDQRLDPPQPTQLREQIVRGKRVEEVFETLYGLEYVQPRYVLRWEGKELSMLSPGERGTLLLVFYLLIDKGDMPLLIDQPEGNLDNHTVAKVLVDCIRAARKRRQVFIVTHNPNLAVVCDADQVVHAHMDKANGNAVTYTTGALENPEITGFVTDVLEGTRWAFGVRGEKYKVGD